jgi:molybdopterin-guanine dinucleotide biosynthesis protein A
MNSDCEVCILAGGRSTRMGRPKARLRLGGRSLLARVRAAARTLGVPVRVIRRDRVPRCGPLGGVYTALVTTRQEAVLFVSCDMPFVTPAALRRTLRSLRRRDRAVFHMDAREGAGFPFVLRAGLLPLVERQLRARRLSLQALARAARARRIAVRRGAGEFLNVNTPADWAGARRYWRERAAGGERAAGKPRLSSP